jgi:hypothetical protein
MHDSSGVMNAIPIHASAIRRGWPVKALAIWLIDACAIVVLALVMLVVNEFKEQPGDDPAPQH